MGVRVEVSPEVDPPLGDESVHPLSLVWEEARVFLVGARVVNVDFGVGDVVVTTDHCGHACVEQRRCLLEPVLKKLVLHVLTCFT